jgi:hypothetical protein
MIRIAANMAYRFRAVRPNEAIAPEPVGGRRPVHDSDGHSPSWQDLADLDVVTFSITVDDEAAPVLEPDASLTHSDKRSMREVRRHVPPESLNRSHAASHDRVHSSRPDPVV